MEEKKKYIPPELSLADQIYVFCHGIKSGFMFYDESPRERFSIPQNVFWITKECVVEWDENINGIRNEDLVIDRGTSIITNSIKKEVTGKRTYNIYTIMVSSETFVNLLKQIDDSKLVYDDYYCKLKKIVFPTKIINYNKDKEKTKSL